MFGPSSLDSDRPLAGDYLQKSALSVSHVDIQESIVMVDIAFKNINIFSSKLKRARYMIREQ